MLSAEEIGQRIREAREEAGLSQEDLGRQLSPRKSHAAISDVERGKTRITVSELANMAAVLGKSVSHFLGTTGTAVYRRGDREIASDRALKASIERFKEEVKRLAQERDKP